MLWQPPRHVVAKISWPASACAAAYTPVVVLRSGGSVGGVCALPARTPTAAIQIPTPTTHHRDMGPIVAAWSVLRREGGIGFKGLKGAPPEARRDKAHHPNDDDGGHQPPDRARGCRGIERRERIRAERLGAVGHPVPRRVPDNRRKDHDADSLDDHVPEEDGERGH